MGVSRAFWKHLRASGARARWANTGARLLRAWAVRTVLHAASAWARARGGLCVPCLGEHGRPTGARGGLHARSLGLPPGHAHVSVRMGLMVGDGVGRLWPCQRTSGRAMGLCRGLTLGLSWALVVARVRGL